MGLGVASSRFEGCQLPRAVKHRHQAYAQTHLQYELSQSTQCHTGGTASRHRSSSHSQEGSSFSLPSSGLSSSREFGSVVISSGALPKLYRHRAVFRRPLLVSSVSVCQICHVRSRYPCYSRAQSKSRSRKIAQSNGCRYLDRCPKYNTVQKMRIPDTCTNIDR